MWTIHNRLMKAIAALMAFKNIGDFHQEMESL
jgi:hypothetical protein